MAGCLLFFWEGYDKEAVKINFLGANFSVVAINKGTEWIRKETEEFEFMKNAHFCYLQVKSAWQKNDKWFGAFVHLVFHQKLFFNLVFEVGPILIFNSHFRSSGFIFVLGFFCCKIHLSFYFDKSAFKRRAIVSRILGFSLWLIEFCMVEVKEIHCIFFVLMG